MIPNNVNAPQQERPIETILLVAVDFSARSDRALRRATLLARQLDASLSLLHVVDGDQPAGMTQARARIAFSILEEMARTIEAFDSVACTFKVTTGDPAIAILSEAENIGAQLLILGAHKRQFRDILSSTTAERTVARARLPILVASGVPSGPYHRTILALAMDEPSRLAAETLGASAITRARAVIAVHAFDAPGRGMLQRAIGDDTAVGDYVANVGLRAAEELGDFLLRHQLPFERRRVVAQATTPAGAILKCAEDEDADLIVVGTSQPKGLKRLILGSVANDVLNASKRDVLVVPS